MFQETSWWCPRSSDAWWWLAVVGFRLIDSPFTTVTRTIRLRRVLTELRDLADFHAAQAQFEVTLDLEKDVKWVPSAIAGERVQFVGVGTVDAVVDFGTLGAGAVLMSDDAKSVTRAASDAPDRHPAAGARAMKP